MGRLQIGEQLQLSVARAPLVPKVNALQELGKMVKYTHVAPPSYINDGRICNIDFQSEGLTERINEPPWGRCLQGAVDVRWVVVVLLLSSPHRGVILG